MLTWIILKDLLTCFQLNWGLRLQPWTAASLVYVSVSLVCCRLQNQAVLTLPQVFMNSSRLYRTCKQQANLSLLWLPKLALMQGVVLLFYSPSPRHAKTMSLLYVSCYPNVYSCSILRCIGSLCWPSKSHHPVSIWITSFLPSLIFHITCQLTQL